MSEKQAKERRKLDKKLAKLQRKLDKILKRFAKKRTELEQRRSRLDLRTGRASKAKAKPARKPVATKKRREAPMPLLAERTPPPAAMGAASIFDPVRPAGAA